MRAFINPYACNECKVCVAVCPVDAIKSASNGISYVTEDCIGCSACASVCPSEAITMIDD